MATRRERVVLELEDNFTSGMARAAAAAALLDKNLNSLSGSSVQTSRAQEKVAKSTKAYTLEMAKADEKSARLRKSLRDQAKAALDLEQGIDRAATTMRRNSADIDKFSGRLRLLTDAALVLGPALVPIGAAAVPALTALAAGFGAAAGAAATALLAFNGMGDALESLSAYQLEPTVANLEKMNEAFAEIGPAGADFARFLNDLTPALDDLQNIARQGLFPGLQEGIEDLLPLLPQVQRIVADIAVSLGDLGADAGSALASDEFREFFDYLESDAAPTMEAFARSTGNVVEGLANLLVAFAPLNRDFVGGMESMTQAFADWTSGLSETQGFQDFVSYIRESGPQVIDLLGAMGTAFVGIVRAAAPVGDAVLPVLTALAQVLGDIANSPIGGPLFTAVAALVAFNRVVTIGATSIDRYSRSMDSLSTSAGKFKAFGGAAAALLLLEQAGAELVRSTDKAAPGIERLTRSLLDLRTAADLSGIAADLGDLSGAVQTLGDPGLAQSIGEVYDKVPLVGSAFADIAPVLSGARQEAREAATTIDALDQALAGLVSSGSAETARATFDDLAAAYGLSADEQAALLDLMPQYQEALDGAANGAALAADATERQGRAAGLTRAQIQGLNAAMEEQTSIALGAFDAVTQYAGALAEAQRRAKQTEAGLDASTKAGRENRDAMSQLAAAWNNQGAAVRNNVEKWREARKSFIDTAVEMGATAKQAKNLADRLLEIPKQRQIDIKLYGSDEAADAIARIRRELDTIPRSIRTDYYVNQVNALNKRGQYATGGPIVGPGTKTSDSVPVMASRGEFMMSAAAVDHYGLDAMFALNARRLAGGGPVDGPRRTLDDQLAVAQAIQQIMDLRRSLAKDGKDKLEGINRRIAELELRRATKELRLTETRERREARSALRAAGAGLSFDSLLPSDPETVAQGVGSAIAAFQREVEAAGGEWTRELRQWARDMRVTAREYDATQAAIKAETERREALIDTLDEQQSQLDDLNRTMAAFGASVAANFLNDGFNQSRTVTGATSPAVAQMQAQLAAIQSGGGAAAGAQASRLMQQIALLQPGETTLTGLDALRDTLSTDTADATAFTAALRQLVTQGLDPLSGFYSELATSGDLLTAQQLVAAGPGGIDELEALWQQRDAATAELAAMTTQAVYGEQQAALVALIAQTNAAIAASDATLVVLNAELLILGEQVRAGSEAGAALLQPQLEDIEQAINALPRNLQALIRQAGGK